MSEHSRRPGIDAVYPYLCVQGAAEAIAFYTEVFGARERFRLTDPSDGRVGHAELEVGGAVIMLSDAYPESGIDAPDREFGTRGPVCIHLHVDDCDALAARAVKAGATLAREPQDQFYGERGCTLRDPFGHYWMIGHSIEEVSPEEMQRRWNEMVGG